MRMQKSQIVVFLFLALATAACGWHGGEALELSGTIEAEEVTVSAEVGGAVLSVNAEEGEAVKDGQEIVRLDDRLYQAALKEAEAAASQALARLEEAQAGSRSQTLAKGAAAVQQAQAGLSTAHARHQQAQSQLARAREQLNQVTAQWEGAKRTLVYQQERLAEITRLFESGASTKRELETQREAVNQAQTAVEQLHAQMEAMRAQYDGAQSELEAAKAQLDVAQAQVKGAQAELDLLAEGSTDYTLKALAAAEQQARARVESARLQVEKTRIASPVDGVLLRKLVTEGEVVKPGAALFTVMKKDRLKLKVYVPEADLGKVNVGDKVDVLVDAYPGEAFSGVVASVAPKAEFTPKNVQTKEERTKMVFAVTIHLENGFDQLKPGMPADVVFAGRERE